MTTTPVIETARLLLRGRTINDFAAYAAIWREPEVVARIGAGQPLSEEDAWNKFSRMAGVWALLGYGFFLVEEKSTGAVIGDIGVCDFKRDITPSLAGMPEFGWVLSSAAHGKGYAKEAVAAVIDWARIKFPGATFCCIIDADNLASIAIAEAFGFRRAATGAYHGGEVVIFHRPPDA
ncbi:MAG: GNAT family N-acetyltransferase [Parvularculaceae bacterium]